jgi:2',3'-cyclic-nucleotide 2'-phosphodiesterase (5'-nucleotidase family)
VNGPGRIVIYHTSDIHARMGFGNRLASMVEPGALLVDSGDALAGSSVFYVADEKVVGELNRAPYAAMAVGNREFHYLHRLFLARARMLRAPLVCSNLIDLREREPVYQRELMVQAGSTPVRILSLLVPQYRTGSGWERIFGWRFLSPDAALSDMLGGTKGSKDPINGSKDRLLHLPTIVLSHLGLAADRQVAARWPGISAILGGHTHEALSQPEIVNDVPIAHPGAYASCVGRLELSVENGTTRMTTYKLLPLS